MTFPHFRNIFLIARPKVDSTVTLAADRLFQLWGDKAYEQANDLSWKEDSGLVPSSSQGHWCRVRQEIGRRYGLVETEPRAKFAA